MSSSAASFLWENLHPTLSKGQCWLSKKYLHVLAFSLWMNPCFFILHCRRNFLPQIAAIYFQVIMTCKKKQQDNQPTLYISYQFIKCTIHFRWSLVYDWSLQETWPLHIQPIHIRHTSFETGWHKQRYIKYRPWGYLQANIDLTEEIFAVAYVCFIYEL